MWRWRQMRGTWGRREAEDSSARLERVKSGALNEIILKRILEFKTGGGSRGKIQYIK
jgi:hypothetical protein